MNERTLSRRLATGVVEALKSHGHILVVKGGTAALARELDELMAPALAIIEPRLGPRAPLSGEPTSTFGHEAIDSAVEEMVAKLTRALMSSDHVEDVFAEDSVIRRDIFRAVRDGLLSPRSLDQEDAHPTVQVKLDTLGYVAATVSRRVDPAELRRALDRAASVAHARFAGFRPELREATFRVEGGGSDERLELEEAVADELADLVEQGVVELPTVERRIDLGRPVPSSEQRAIAARVDAIAESTLLRAGCAAAWDFADPRTLRITFTPLSDQDARGVDAPTSAFARDLAALLATEAGRRAGHRPGLRADKPPSAPGAGHRAGPRAGEPPSTPGAAAAAPRPAPRAPASPAVEPEPEPKPVSSRSKAPPEAKPTPARAKAAEPRPDEEGATPAPRAAADGGSAPAKPAASKSAPKRTAKRAAKRADDAAEPAEPAAKPRAAKAKAADRASTTKTTRAKTPAKKR